MNKKEFNKIYFSCRRGIWELDIVFINFLKFEFFNLTKDELNNFKLLLLNEDQDLYSWIIKSEKCKNVEFNNLIYKIKQFISYNNFIY